MTALQAFGGGPLVGDRIVRLAYFDKSGTGDPKSEPHVVMCAFVVHPDKQWRQLREYLADMADNFVPADKRHMFKGFHAYELFSGGKVFERNPDVFGYWWPVLDELVSIPGKFDLPVIFGSIGRSFVAPGTPPARSAEKMGVRPVVGAQLMAFSQACMGIEHWMGLAADADEVIDMVMENNDETKDFIKIAHRIIAESKAKRGARRRHQGAIL